MSHEPTYTTETTERTEPKRAQTRSCSVLSVGCSENVPLSTPMVESGGSFDRHVKPEGFKLPDVPPDGTLSMPLVEGVGPEFVVRDAVAHNVVGDVENLVSQIGRAHV